MDRGLNEERRQATWPTRVSTFHSYEWTQHPNSHANTQEEKKTLVIVCIGLAQCNVFPRARRRTLSIFPLQSLSVKVKTYWPFSLPASKLLPVAHKARRVRAPASHFMPLLPWSFCCSHCQLMRTYALAVSLPSAFCPQTPSLPAHLLREALPDQQAEVTSWPLPIRSSWHVVLPESHALCLLLS